MRKIKMFVPNDKTFAQGCEEYLDNCCARNLRDGTTKHYRDSIRQIQKYIDGDMYIRDITKETFDSFIKALRNNKNLNSMVDMDEGMTGMPKNELYKKVELTELFYDLVFVYAVSRSTELIRHLSTGGSELYAVLTFAISDLYGKKQMQTYRKAIVWIILLIIGFSISLLFAGKANIVIPIAGMIMTIIVGLEYIRLQKSKSLT